jgi:alkanesulfonate monooxygenase SsuD/methylene tetrahydromethanopterin reductase-like flavin-dependent oxidoreductase (luciferase family)
MKKFAILAEKVGFDSVWMADHAYLQFEALTTLSAIAMKTKNLKLGTCVIDLNRRNPATLAQMVSTIDTISRGRFIFGVGSGVWNEAFYGFALNKPVSRMREGIQIVKKFWTEPTVNYTGSFYKFENASIQSKPFQKPHPPIWIAAFSPRMIRIVAELGNGFITQNLPPEVYREKLDELKCYAKRVGREFMEIETVFASPMSISPNYDVALRSIEPLARQFLVGLVKSSPEFHLAERLGYETSWSKPEDVPLEIIDRCFIFGTPDDCIDKIQGYIEAGVKYFISLRLLPPGIDSLKLFAEKVIPHFKK